MNNLIVNLVFAILSIIFLIGIIIIILNAVKIKKLSDLLTKRLKEENRINLAYIKSEIQNKILSLIPQTSFQLPDPLNQKLLPLLIQSKTVA